MKGGVYRMLTFLLYAVKTFHYGHYHFLKHFIVYIHHGVSLLSFKGYY